MDAWISIQYPRIPGSLHPEVWGAEKLEVERVVGERLVPLYEKLCFQWRPPSRILGPQDPRSCGPLDPWILGMNLFESISPGPRTV